MSGVSWPKIGVIPAPLPEHATHLKHEATALLDFASGKAKDGKPKKTVQWSYIEAFVVSVKELTERVLNQPGTAQIAADLGALVRRMDSVEQNTTITKNLLETPVDRNSNSSTTTGYRNTRLWAQVAAQAMPPPSAASFPSTFAAQSTEGTRIDLSTPDDRRVVIKLDPTYIDHYRTLTPKALRDRVTSHIHASNDPNIAYLRVVAAKQLRSGDLAVYTQTVAEKEALQTNPSWTKAFGASKVVATTYGVIAHGIPTNSVRMDDQKQTIARIQAENHKIGNEKDIPISYVGWLCVPKRAAGSMVVEFTDAEQANVALQTGLIWDSEYKKTELYDRACRIQECFRCHRYGHISAQCGGQQKCGICAEGHRSEDCPSKDLGKRKCASCGGPHRARDSKCPEFQKEAIRVQMARNTKQTRWRVLTASAQTTPSAAPSTTQSVPIPSSTPQAGIYTFTNNLPPTRTGANAAPSKASVVKGLQRAPALPTPKPGLTLNTNGKRPASPTKIGSNRTPLGAINNNGRAKRSITKSLKQKSIDADAEWEGNQRGTVRGREGTSGPVESTSTPETRSEEADGEREMNRESENLTTDTTVSTGL